VAYRREGVGNIENIEELRFSGEKIECCVSVVDIVESTTVTSNIGTSRKIAKYYSIFINNMSAIGKKFGGLITKIAGDSLVLYFPQTSNKNDRQAFKIVVECGKTMLAAFRFINHKMSQEYLPVVNYRISSDYGRIEIGRSNNSNRYDLFGSTMDICSEINRMATLNGMVIGSNLYQIIKSFPSPLLGDYKCEPAGTYLVGELKKDVYPVYSIAIKQQQRAQSGGEQETQYDLESTNKLKEKVSLIRNSGSPGKILLVDGDSDILWTYKALLEVEGYQVDTFSNSEDALKQFSQSDPSYYDLVLLDIRMPRLNGLQLFYRMKSIDMNTKVIFVSALDVAKELLIILPGIKIDKHIIKKPIGREPFLERINAMMAEPQT
jgi:CheY-like chemotaxis protein